MDSLKLYMVLLGCRPPGRFTEQHDIFFGIGTSLKNIIPDIIKSWPEAKGKIHLDAFREVTCVDGYRIEVIEKILPVINQEEEKLFFINLAVIKKMSLKNFIIKCWPSQKARVKQSGLQSKQHFSNIQGLKVHPHTLMINMASM